MPIFSTISGPPSKGRPRLQGGKKRKGPMDSIYTIQRSPSKGGPGQRYLWNIVGQRIK